MFDSGINDQVIKCPICGDVFLYWQWEAHVSRGHSVEVHEASREVK